MNSVIFKLTKGDSFKTFYYGALSTVTSQELSEFIRLNKWYFQKMNDEIKEQLRYIYSLRREREEML